MFFFFSGEAEQKGIFATSLRVWVCVCAPGKHVGDELPRPCGKWEFWNSGGGGGGV